MENIELPVKKIKRARIGYFDKGKNGSYLPKDNAYTYFLELHNVCINIFHAEEECNVYKRLPYPHYDKNGKPNGNRIVLISGKEEDGVCYIIDENYKIDYPLDYISSKELEEIIIESDDFIVDRVYILGLRNDLKTRFKYMKKKKEDNENLEKLQQYILSREEKPKIYKKN